MTTERRRAPRLKTFKGGLIIFGLSPPVDCIVRNLSEFGAGLELKTPAPVPDNFTLLLKPELTRRNCRVVWRSENRLGVEFAEHA
jgi:hypothetical protein